MHSECQTRACATCCATKSMHFSHSTARIRPLRGHPISHSLQRMRAFCVRSCAENHRVTTFGPTPSADRGGVTLPGTHKFFRFSYASTLGRSTPSAKTADRKTTNDILSHLPFASRCSQPNSPRQTCYFVAVCPLLCFFPGFCAQRRVM